MHISERILADIEMVCEVHQVSRYDRTKLVRIVLGAIRGNRDAPIFGFCVWLEKTIQEASGKGSVPSLFDMLQPESGTPRKSGRFNHALLDFLCSMDDYKYFDRIREAFDHLATHGENALADATRIIASALHAYRMDHIPFQAERQKFEAIRSYLSEERDDLMLQDDDPIEFWFQKAGKDEKWTKYQTVLFAFRDFHAQSALHATSFVSYEALQEKGFDSGKTDPAGIPEGTPDQIHDADLSDPTTDATAEAFEPDIAMLIEQKLEHVTELDFPFLQKEQISHVRRLARLNGCGQRWVKAGLIYLSLYPAQTSLIEFIRKKAPTEKLRAIATCKDVLSFDDIANLYDTIARDIRALETIKTAIADLRSETGKSFDRSAVAGRLASEEAKRFLRRKTFEDVTSNALWEDLRHAVSELHPVEAHINSHVTAWKAFLNTSEADVFERLRSRFSEKLCKIYQL